MPLLVALRPYLLRIVIISLALLMAYLYFSVRYQFAHMGPIFIQDSWSGKKALTLYLIGDYNGAARAYRKHFAGLDLPPSSAIETGQWAILRGELKTAKAIATKALEQNSNDDEALLNLAEVALLEGDTLHAKEYMEEILRKDADHADALVLASLSATRSQDYNGAIESLNRLLRQSRIGSRTSSFFTLLEFTGDLADLPSNERPYNVLALYARYLRIFDPSNGPLAIRYAEKAIDRGDRPEDAYLTIGIVHNKEGSKQKAIEAFRKSIEANPKYPLAYWWAAFAYGNIGDLSNEYKMSKAAADASPGDPFYGRHFTYVLTEKLGDYHQSVAYLRTVVLIHPDSADAQSGLAYSLDFTGNYEESVSHYREAIRLNPQQPELYESLANTLARAKHLTDAVATLQQAIQKFPMRPKFHARLGDLYYDRNRAFEAVREYEEALRLGEFEHKLCLAYRMVSNPERSAECFQRILKQNPDDQYAIRNLPEVLKDLKYLRSRR